MCAIPVINIVPLSYLRAALSMFKRLHNAD
jgi:hypothetical protein